MRVHNWTSLLASFLVIMAGLRLVGSPVAVQESAAGANGGQSEPRASSNQAVRTIDPGKTTKDAPETRGRANVERSSGLEQLIVPEILKGVAPYRHALDFGNAVFAATLAQSCECDPATALKKISPIEEHREVLRLPLNVISTAIGAEKLSLTKNGTSKVRLLSVAVVVRSLGTVRGGTSAEIAYSGFLCCDEPPGPRGNDAHGTAVTIIWDAFPKGGPVDGLEATLWMQFLVTPGDPSGRGAESPLCGVESRRLRFALKGEQWVNK